MTIPEKYKEFIGRTFGHVVVVEIMDKRVDGKVMVKVRCECGKEKIVRLRHLLEGGTKSCGTCDFKSEATRSRCTLNLTGKRFGKLVALKPTDIRDGSFVVWDCLCDCGRHTLAPSHRLMHGRKRSCGQCGYKAEATRARCQIYKTEEEKILGLNIFQHMRERCYNKNDPAYPNWGGRGIYICDEWMKDRTKFVKWGLENGYKKGLSIDRIDVNGPYSPENCRWADNFIQANNRTNNHWLTVGAVTHTLAEWARIYGVPSDRFYCRPDTTVRRYIQILEFAKQNLTEEKYKEFIKDRLLSSSAYRRHFGNPDRIISNDRGNKMIQVLDMNQSCTRWDAYFLLPDGYTQRYCKEHGIDETARAIENRLAGKVTDYGIV